MQMPSLRWTKVMRVLGMLALLSCPVGAAAQQGGADLLKQYPATIGINDATGKQDCDWAFTPSDMFTLTSFRYAVDNRLTVETGPADLGIGHCEYGAVWALVIPRGEGRLVGNMVPQPGTITHVWMRFHPALLDQVFPAETVRLGDNPDIFESMQHIAKVKNISSWHNNGRLVIPPGQYLNLDIGTKENVRRFFAHDTSKKTLDYLPQFESRTVEDYTALDADVLAKCFDELCDALESKYARFALRPDVNWEELKAEFRPKAIEAGVKHKFAWVCSEMLSRFRDPGISLLVKGATVPVFIVPQVKNTNPSAHRLIFGRPNQAGRSILWTKTDAGVGIVSISSWNDTELANRFDEVLEKLRETEGLIIDLRLSNGMDEKAAIAIAARFAAAELTYGYSQKRSGEGLTDLTAKTPLTLQPRGPWTYEKPVCVLVGSRTESAAEAFVSMMELCSQVVTIGSRTAGMPTEHESVTLPADLSIVVPTAVRYAANGREMVGVGITPTVRFLINTESFMGQRDDLLVSAFERLAPESSVADSSTPAPLVVPETKPDTPDTEPPKVVFVYPARAATDAKPVTEIRIRFDQPMDPTAINLNWSEGSFKPMGPWRYDSKNNEFIIPAIMKPSEPQRITMNMEVNGQVISGFRSALGVLAKTHAWSFHTSPEEDIKSEEPPIVIGIEPAPGTTVGRLVPVRITFDRPMDPDHFHHITVEEEGKDPYGLPYFYVQYEPDSNTFVVPVLLPADFSGNLLFHGFRSVDKRHSLVPDVGYSTRLALLSSEHDSQLRVEARGAALIELLNQMAETRRSISSLIERVRITQFAPGRATIYNSTRSCEIEFRLLGDSKYYADVSSMMNRSFIIGSDGYNCWWFTETPKGKQLVTCPTKLVDNQFVVVCDPFQLGRYSAVEIADQNKLEYVGIVDLNGKPQHLVQGWFAMENMGKVSTNITRWWVDPTTFRLTQVNRDWASGSRILQEFTYKLVNEPISASMFVPPTGSDVRQLMPAPLNAQFDTRFLHVIDPSNGQASVRWGRQGSGGESAVGVR